VARRRSVRIYSPEPEELMETVVAGQWLRASKYSEAHMVARRGTEAVCGRPLLPSLHAWVVLAPDNLKRCTRCTGKDYS
jgi:hypothetical protein